MVFASNAESVRECFGGTESPARSAACLISDCVDAMSPFLSGIKATVDIFSVDERGIVVSLNAGSSKIESFSSGKVTERVFLKWHWLP